MDEVKKSFCFFSFNFEVLVCFVIKMLWCLNYPLLGMVIYFVWILLTWSEWNLQKVARRLIFGKGNEKLDYQTDDRRKRINKFKESAWKCIYYLSAEVLALSVTYDEPWFTNTRYFWVGPGSQVWPDQKIK